MIIHSEDQNHLKKCKEFLEDRCYKSFSELFATGRLKILVELLTMYSFSKARITQALSMCAMGDETFTHPEKISGKPLPLNAIASYVSTHLMAILASFTSTLSLDDTNLKVKLQILKS